ncbi:MAG: hypothetical protein GY722_27840 [bacterium]|nr:hypothetical protein [bacterium]
MESQEQEYRPGTHQVLAAALSDLQIVDESQLSWEQVLEFRRDSDARLKYRRLMRWIDSQLNEYSPCEIEERFALKLDDYEWALRKHGIKSALGTVSCLIDPKFLASVSAAVAGTAVAAGGLWAALTGLTLVAGKAVATFGTAAIDAADERRGSNYEIAYAHEIKKRLGQ